MNKKTFYFNTGVNACRYGNKVEGGVVTANGTIVIPFDCYDVPENAIFKYASSVDNLHLGNELIICREIHNSALYSKYAYFAIPFTRKGDNNE